jgi:hypothetical protein
VQQAGILKKEATGIAGSLIIMKFGWEEYFFEEQIDATLRGHVVVDEFEIEFREIAGLFKQIMLFPFTFMSFHIL